MSTYVKWCNWNVYQCDFLSHGYHLIVHPCKWQSLAEMCKAGQCYQYVKVQLVDGFLILMCEWLNFISAAAVFVGQ
jgi:hypothetical protein